MPTEKDPLAARARDVVDPASTRWIHRREIIRTPPQAMSARVRSTLRLGHLSSRDRRKPLSLTIKYRGGSEAWYEVRTRGVVVRAPGWVALHDLMEQINTGGGK